jgi:predicted ATPase/DNA-binding winged helix-turn-helix (wHTH) protein
MPDHTLTDAIDIRPAERLVLVNGKPAGLGARAFDVLMALYERRERLVSKNELLELVWPGVVVEENNLQVQVSHLRRVLGPKAISTIPGRGYRFTLPEEALTRRRAEPPSTADAANEAPAAASAAHDLPRGNLPAPARLFGREKELAALVELMGAHPVVSIVGAGGIGKTSLALAAARSCTLDTPDGRWWVELAPLAAGSQLPATIAAALRLQLGGDRQPVDALGAILAKHRGLLVLDNCEHLADAAADVIASLRAQAPGVHVLVTSQELLECVDEQTFRLSSLALPEADDLDTASRFGAVALFVARAHAADQRFALSAGNVATVIEICRRLDGIPLAIELAAARVPMLGVQGLHARLNQMFNVLTGSARIRLRRHQTLRAALEWSHGLLTEDERAVFRRLGVFASGFTLELAQGVAADERIDRWMVLDLLARLIDKSLVLAEGEGEPRYRLLEPTRAYALEQLAAAGESAAWLRRHAEVLIGSMANWNAGRHTQPQAERFRVLAELGNVRAAADWAMRPEGDRRLAIRLLSVAWGLWGRNNLWTEFVARMAALWPLPPDLPAAEEAAFCLAFASVRGAGHRDDVLQAARRAVELYRALGDTVNLIDALRCIGVISCEGGDVTEADAAIAEAAAMIGPTTPTGLRANVAGVQGLRALHLRRFAEAADGYRRQAALCREDGSEFGEYLALSNLAWVSLDVGEVDAAIETLERAIAGLERIRAPYGLGPLRSLSTLAHAIRGDDQDGLRNAREAYQVMLTRGPRACDKPLMSAAAFHARRGDSRRAAVVFGCVEGPNVRGNKQLCPMDEMLDNQVRAMVTGRMPEHERFRCWELGKSLTLAEVAAIAFDAAPIDSVNRPHEPASGRPHTSEPDRDRSCRRRGETDPTRQSRSDPPG